jgi:Zn-dependent membrane protease YugP
MENWESVMNTKNTARAEIARGLLEQNGIDAVIMDRKDSSYSNIFGYADVMVPIEYVEAAKALLANEVSPE